MQVESKQDMLRNVELFNDLMDGDKVRAGELLDLFDMTENSKIAEPTDVLTFEKTPGEWLVAPVVFAACPHKELRTFLKQRPNATAKQIRDFVTLLSDNSVNTKPV